jgi:hypothetical protein
MSSKRVQPLCSQFCSQRDIHPSTGRRSFHDLECSLSPGHLRATSHSNSVWMQIRGAGQSLGSRSISDHSTGVDGRICRAKIARAKIARAKIARAKIAHRRRCGGASTAGVRRACGSTSRVPPCQCLTSMASLIGPLPSSTTPSWTALSCQPGKAGTGRAHPGGIGALGPVSPLALDGGGVCLTGERLPRCAISAPRIALKLPLLYPAAPAEIDSEIGGLTDWGDHESPSTR